MSDRCPIDSDPVSFRELLEVVTSEVGPVVGDDGIGHAESVNNVQEELDCFLGVDRGYRFCLYPFCELSIATSKWVNPPGAFLSGPTMSRPHTANGHVMGMV